MNFSSSTKKCIRITQQFDLNKTFDSVINPNFQFINKSLVVHTKNK